MSKSTYEEVGGEYDVLLNSYLSQVEKWAGEHKRSRIDFWIAHCLYQNAIDAMFEKHGWTMKEFTSKIGQ